MELPSKVCPACRVEYVPSALECSDCRVALVDPAALPDPAEAGLSAASDLTPIRVENGRWIQALAACLDEAGIAHRVEAAAAPPGRHSGPLFALFVRPEDEAPARAVDAEVLRRELPELAELRGADVERGEDACPACGSAVRADAPECPDCGLNFDGGEG